jgi:FkbM family methyltransferase
MFSLLSFNISSNSLRNVTENQLAVSDTCNETIFEVFEEPSISRLKPSGVNCGETNARQTKVNCVSLDQYLKGKRIPNLIKIDVEGAELAVLKGMGDLLSIEAMSAPVLIFEFCQANTQRFGYEPMQLITHLNNFGFSVYWLSKNAVIPVNVAPEHFQTHYPENNLIAAKSEACVHLA